MDNVKVGNEVLFTDSVPEGISGIAPFFASSLLLCPSITYFPAWRLNKKNITKSPLLNDTKSQASKYPQLVPTAGKACFPNSNDVCWLNR